MLLCTTSIGIECPRDAIETPRWAHGPAYRVLVRRSKCIESREERSLALYTDDASRGAAVHAHEAQCDCPVSDALRRVVNGLCGRKRRVRSRAELCRENYVMARAKPWVSRDADPCRAPRTSLQRCNDRTSAIYLLLVFSEHSISARISTIYAFRLSASCAGR